MKEKCNRRLFVGLIWLLKTSLLCGAPPETMPLGYFNFVSTVPGNKKLTLSYQQAPLCDPLGCGEMTGGQGLPPGNHTLTATHPDYPPASLQLKLDPDHSSVVVASLMERPISHAPFSETVLRLSEIPGNPSAEGYSITAIGYTSRRSLPVSVAGQNVSLIPASPFPLETVSRQVEITYRNRRVRDFHLESPGHYFLILIHDPGNDSLQTSLVYDVLFQTPFSLPNPNESE